MLEDQCSINFRERENGENKEGNLLKTYKDTSRNWRREGTKLKTYPACSTPPRMKQQNASKEGHTQMPREWPVLLASHTGDCETMKQSLYIPQGRRWHPLQNSIPCHIWGRNKGIFTKAKIANTLPPIYPQEATKGYAPSKQGSKKPRMIKDMASRNRASKRRAAKEILRMTARKSPCACDRPKEHPDCPEQTAGESQGRWLQWRKWTSKLSVMGKIVLRHQQSSWKVKEYINGQRIITK